MIRAVLREYVPASWFHPRGIKKVLRRLTPRLPDVSGKLFLTFTLARETCGGDPETAFEYARAKLRRVFYRLRNGVEWEGKRYEIDAPYCVKIEFHRDGWAHFHVIFLTNRFLPCELLNSLWGLGRCNVQRISSRDFHYLLKYVCKGFELPEWILRRGRLRVFQSSHGFLKEKAEAKEPEAVEAEGSDKPAHKRHEAGNIGERLERWEKLGLLESGSEGARHFCCVPLRENFRTMLVQMVLHLAVEDRYLGEERVLITCGEDLLEWTAA